MMPELVQLLFEGRCHGDAVEDRVHGNAGETCPLGEGDPELLIRLQQFRIDLFQTLRRCLLFRRRIIDHILVVDGRILHVGPCRLFHRQPVAERLQPPFQQPFGFPLLAGDQTDDVLTETARSGVRFDIGDETVLVLAVRERFNCRVFGAHVSSCQICGRRRQAGCAAGFAGAAAAAGFVTRRAELFTVDSPGLPIDRDAGSFPSPAFRSTAG